MRFMRLMKVTDGPFGETKEVLGGSCLTKLPGRRS
jgi:hypothetical protein